MASDNHSDAPYPGKRDPRLDTEDKTPSTRPDFDPPGSNAAPEQKHCGGCNNTGWFAAPCQADPTSHWEPCEFCEKGTANKLTLVPRGQLKPVEMIRCQNGCCVATKDNPLCRCENFRYYNETPTDDPWLLELRAAIDNKEWAKAADWLLLLEEAERGGKLPTPDSGVKGVEPPKTVCKDCRCGVEPGRKFCGECGGMAVNVTPSPESPEDKAVEKAKYYCHVCCDMPCSCAAIAAGGPGMSGLKPSTHGRVPWVNPALLDEWVRGAKHIEYYQFPDTLTIVCGLTLGNGFTIVGSTTCGDPHAFDYEIGCGVALDRCREQLRTLLEFGLLCEASL